MRIAPASPDAVVWRVGLFVIAAALSATLAGSADAQVVVGTVTEQGSGAPSRGALVMLLDSAGQHAGSVVADARGYFRVQAPRAGTYRVCVERVGAPPVQSRALTLAAGEERGVSLRVPAVVALAGIEAAGEPRCGPLPADGEGDVARVWDEARKALVLTIRTATDGLAGYRYTLYHRESDLRRRVNLTSKERTRTMAPDVSGRVPFASRPARELARQGYVRVVNRRATDWFGPDAQVLLSDLFLEQHCFYLRRGEGERAAWVGLAFAPVRSRGIPDVRGVLWLDRATAELRRLEFTYTGVEVRDVSPTDSLTEPPVPGGEVRFTRLASGAWIVSEWELRGVIADRVIGSPGGSLALHRPMRWLIAGGYVHDTAAPVDAIPPPARTEPAPDSVPPPQQVEEIVLPVTP